MVDHKDVTIKGECEIEQVIELACSVRSNWSPGDVQVKRFTDGITNRLFGCYHASNVDDVILIRIYGAKTELFIDRKKEHQMMKLMNEAALAPPVFFSFNNGLCYGYTPGQAATYEMVTDATISKLIAFQMAKMHSVISKLPSAVKLNTGEPCLFRNVTKFIQLTPSALQSPKLSSAIGNLPTLNQLHQEMVFLQDIIDRKECRIVFCHNDLLLKNIIYYQKPGPGVTFIDFEYADFNYQAFDIANHFCEFVGTDVYLPQLYPSEEFQSNWITNYVTAYDKLTHESLDQQQSSQCKTSEEQITLQVNKLMSQVKCFTLHSHFSWAMWSFLQAVNSSIDFDFIAYGINRWTEYQKAKERLLKEDGHSVKSKV